MPPSKSDQALVREMLKEVLAGREDPEGFFAICLSVLGHRETYSVFQTLIKPLSTANTSVHSTLTLIYEEYFSKVSCGQT